MNFINHIDYTVMLYYTCSININYYNLLKKRGRTNQTHTRTQERAIVSICTNIYIYYIQCVYVHVECLHIKLRVRNVCQSSTPSPTTTYPSVRALARSCSAAGEEERRRWGNPRAAKCQHIAHSALSAPSTSRRAKIRTAPLLSLSRGL